ncbi:MAG: hypothetical protein IPH28_04060 [Cytophagaceae bacterium]|nr:hypothetical protein [Cytophagaceae bacterium]
MKIFKILLLIFIAGFTVYSCNEKEIEFEEVSDNEVSEFNSKESTNNIGVGLLSKGAAWKEWNKYFKDCMQSSTLQKAQFAGYSNSIRLGDLRLKGGVPSYSLDDLDTTVLKKLVKPIGNLANGCSRNQKRNNDLFAEIGASFINVADPTLNAAFSWNDSISLNTINFVQYEINVSLLKRELNENERLKDFKKELKEKGSRVVAQLMKCKNATFTINLNRELADTLGVKLDKGLLEKVKLGDANIDVNFKRINKKQIQGSVTDEFVIFMNMIKIK